MRLPLTLRLMFFGLRSSVFAVMIVLLGWAFLVPVTSVERIKLGSNSTQARPQGLWEMRIAQAMISYAPDASARLFSTASNGEISPELAGMILRQLANGQIAQPSNNQATQARDTGGAKFVTAGNP